MGGPCRQGRILSAFPAGLRGLGGLLLLAPLAAAAADIYASRAPDGSVRYATQKLDDSYALVLQEPAPAATRPPAAGRSRQPAPAADLDALIQQIATRHGVAKELVLAVIRVESGFNPKALSPKGARGAMQLTPGTGRAYGLRATSEFEDPARNIDAGVRHLKDLLARYQGNVPLALAAYNAGAGSVDRHGNRIPPYPETMLYVAAVLSGTRGAD